MYVCTLIVFIATSIAFNICRLSYSSIIIIYCMNHGYYGVYNKHTTLVLGHQKFTTDKPLALWAQGLSVVNFL